MQTEDLALLLAAKFLLLRQPNCLQWLMTTVQGLRPMLASTTCTETPTRNRHRRRCVSADAEASERRDTFKSANSLVSSGAWVFPLCRSFPSYLARTSSHCRLRLGFRAVATKLMIRLSFWAYTVFLGLGQALFTELTAAGQPWPETHYANSIQEHFNLACLPFSMSTPPLWKQTRSCHKTHRHRFRWWS